MKKYFILPITLAATSLFSQFNVSGQIENYANKAILVKLYENGNPKTVLNTKTDAAGNFKAKIPVAYTGMVKIDIPSGGGVSVLSDNENIQFKTIYGENIQNELQIIDGKAQKEYINLQKIAPLNDLEANVFPHIKNMYQPSDTFYKAIETEQKRIADLNNNQKISSPLVKYVNDLEKLLQATKSNPTQEHMNVILNHMQNDDERLEQSGYFTDLIFAFINYQFSNHTSESGENNLQKATDALLEKGNIETERGQNILSTILNLAPEANFPTFYKNYTEKVKGLTCKVTEDLKSKVNGTKTLKVGDKVPNINFGSPVKGKKSLYDIKANKKLIVFWASWCPACNKEMPYVKEFYNDFKKEGGEIVAVSLDYDLNDFNNSTKDFGWYNYTDLLRWDSPIVELYNVQSTPTLILLDKDNKVIQIMSHISELNK